MNDLIARLESAAEGSRELDREILLSLGYSYVGAGGLELPWCDESRDHWFKGDITTSLDAITALIAEKLPEHSMSSFRSAVEEMPAHARIWCVNEDADISGTAKTEPLARCAALLRALQEQGK